jgi:hypothetical protein
MPEHDDGGLLPAALVQQRYHVTAMSIWRWLRKPGLAFPRPLVINGRRYWRFSELLTWERGRALASSGAAA